MPSDQRRALLRSLVSSLLWNDEIDTTEARAKEASRLAEKVITLAKKDDLAARRIVHGLIFEQNIPFQGSSNKLHSKHQSGHQLLHRIFTEVVPLYRDVRGGYTRLIRLGPRRGDGAMMVRVELTKGVSVGHRSGQRKRSADRASGAPAPAAPTGAPALAGTAPVQPVGPSVEVPPSQAEGDSGTEGTKE